MGTSRHLKLSVPVAADPSAKSPVALLGIVLLLVRSYIRAAYLKHLTAKFSLVAATPFVTNKNNMRARSHPKRRSTRRNGGPHGCHAVEILLFFRTLLADQSSRTTHAMGSPDGTSSRTITDQPRRGHLLGRKG